MPHTEPDHNEGPGSAVVMAYIILTLWGLLLGLGLGWLIWG